MKKQVIIATLVAIAAICGVTGYCYLSDMAQPNALALANIEALSRYELPPVTIECGNTTGYGYCYDLKPDSEPCPPSSQYTTSVECIFTGISGNYCIPFSC